jgi:Fe-S oxidoreductase
MMEKAANGKWAAAYKMFRNAVVFPDVVSSLCPAACKEDCARADLGDEPIDLPLIERAVVGYSKKKTAENYVIPPKNQRVAVVGAGVSGLACALDLAQKKYQVTVFDMNDGWGGGLRGHADFGIFDSDFALQFGAVSLTWGFGREISSLDELFGFDAVYLATGEGGNDFGLADSYDPLVFATKEPRVYLGGGIVGAALAESIVAGTKAALHIEAFLQTGRTNAVAAAEKKNCSRHVSNEGAQKAPRVLPLSGGAYTEDEAMLEAARCLLCDCSSCMESCDMLGAYRKKPRKIAMEVFTDSKVTPPYSSHTMTRETYSCNICSRCKSVCPEGINMGELFLRSRRDRHETGEAPYAMHDYWRREMEFNTSVASFHAAPGGTCRYVFFPGCQLGAYNPEHVLKTYGILTKKLDCGVFVGCCGAPAFWAGDEGRMNANLDLIRETSKTLDGSIFIFACATCETMFREYLPEIERVPLYKLLSEDGMLAPALADPDWQTNSLPGGTLDPCSAARSYPQAAVFDPCAARGDSDMMDSVRSLAEMAGMHLEELAERNRCCGYGGLVRGGNPKMYDKIVQNRADMSDKPYLVYCANCRDVFMSRGKDCIHILDAALNLQVENASPTISERRKNSMFVKAMLARELKNEVFEPELQPWDDIRLVIEKELAERIDRKLISEDDMKEAIWLAESTGDKFRDEADGSASACLVRRLLTYWVRYRMLADGGAEVLDAYYHRMRFEAESS